MHTTAILFGTVLFLLNYFVSSNAIQVRQRRLSPTFTLTLVHGDVNAMKNHIDALNYCRKLGKPKDDAEIGYNLKDITNHTITKTTSEQHEKTNVKTTVHSNTESTETGTGTLENKDHSDLDHTIVESDGTRYRSDLLSIHDGHMVNELMRWVLKTDKRQFWIGGVVKMVQYNIADYPIMHHLLQLWTDRTPANFRFLHYNNAMMHNMHTDDIACVSVDYASGKWGLHSCDTRMFFVCETVELSKVPKDTIKPVIKEASSIKTPQTATLSTDAHTTSATNSEAHTSTEVHTTEVHTSTTEKTIKA